ncbi:hypothetical protein [Acinetobacter venetianus]|uniref:hypothetical protein n=1 Tax=Acinetobacter venetianus TaxID=52133 RepID=UPI003A8CE8CE
MLTASEIEQHVLVRLQDFPEIAARYATGDPSIRANIAAQITMSGLLGFEIDVSEVEPFLKSRERTILADATNKGILPIANPCKHTVRFMSSHNAPMTIYAGRTFEDVQGRAWRLLETANIPANGEVDVQAEQSVLRTISYTAITSDPFQQVVINLQSDMYLANIAVKDSENNNYVYKPRWMNTDKGEYAVNFKTDTRRQMIVEFGDSDRFGRTLIANTEIIFSIIETYGEIDVSKLKEAILSEILNSNEQKIKLKFVDSGLIQAGVDPLSIDSLRLLSSYPYEDEDAVFLGEFDYNVRKKFMSEASYIHVWNETIQELHYGASIDNINHLFAAIKPINTAEQATLESKVAQHIGKTDSLYKGRVNFIEVEERAFNITITAKLNPVHDLESVKQQITTLLLGLYGKGKLAASYYLSDGFNIQEISKKIRENILAFQDQISNYYITPEDLKTDPIKPHQWLYLSASSIHFDITVSANHGQGQWTLGG